MRFSGTAKGGNRNKGATLKSLQRGGDGRTSAWAAPASLPVSLSLTANDSRWSQTANNRSI